MPSHSRSQPSSFSSHESRKLIEKIEKDYKANKFRSFTQLTKDFHYYKKVPIPTFIL